MKTKLKKKLIALVACMVMLGMNFTTAEDLDTNPPLFWVKTPGSAPELSLNIKETARIGSLSASDAYRISRRGEEAIPGSSFEMFYNPSAYIVFYVDGDVQDVSIPLSDLFTNSGPTQALTIRIAYQSPSDVLYEIQTIYTLTLTPKVATINVGPPKIQGGPLTPVKAFVIELKVDAETIKGKEKELKMPWDDDSNDYDYGEERSINMPWD